MRPRYPNFTFFVDFFCALEPNVFLPQYLIYVKEWRLNCGKSVRKHLAIKKLRTNTMNAAQCPFKLNSKMLSNKIFFVFYTCFNRHHSNGLNLV